MIFILHGEDLPKSRDTILKLTKKLAETPSKTVIKKEIDINEVAPSEIIELLGSVGLFSEQPFIVLDISSAGKMNLKPYADILSSAPEQAYIAIISNKELSKNNPFIKIAKEIKAKVIVNNLKPEANVFSFVDSLLTGQKSRAYKEYDLLMKEDNDPYYTFTMVLYGLRNIAATLYETQAVKKMAPYTRSKNTSIAKNYDQKRIQQLYKNLYELDLSFKTGKITGELLIPMTIEKVLR